MKIKVLNLNSRPDRWQNICAELINFGAKDWQRFSAYNGGYTGFNRSMSEILQGEKEVLILEDDAVFHGQINALMVAKSKLPDDWDLLYLGANVLSEQKRYTDGIYHLTDGWTSHAILYSDKGADYCAKNFDHTTGIVYDEWLRTVVQKQLKCFIMSPMLATQRDDYSDIQNAVAIYDLKQTEKYLK